MNFKSETTTSENKTSDFCSKCGRYGHTEESHEACFPSFIACIMAGNSEKYIELCIKAVEPFVDKIIVCYDTSSKDGTLQILKDLGATFIEHLTAKQGLNPKIEVIQREYEHDLNCKTANGDQRNFYLSYLKAFHMNDWVLCLDADEIVSEEIRDFRNHIEELESQNIYLLSPKMEHFIQDFSHVDSTHEVHYVINRLFKVHNELFYPKTEHPVLQTTKNVASGKVENFTIFHLAYCREMFYILDRYKNHLAKSEIHSSDFLQNWTYAHYMGQYPKRDFNILSLPKILKEHFLIDDDFFYFQSRGLEAKHFIDSADWKEFLEGEGHCNTSSVIEFGCGRGPRIYAMDKIGIDCLGIELSQYAVKHKISEFVELGDVLDYRYLPAYRKWRMSLAYDLLEHIEEKDLNKAIDTLKYHTSQYILISVPMMGDPNLEADKTHKILWTREQWENKLKENHLKIIPIPEHWQFRNQLILCEVNK